jgi:AcrR family transcriptional regulator
MASRKYEQRERAQKQADTRRRIEHATMELHDEVGPARTTVSDVAKRAGVSRLTVYNNFPDERSLIEGCRAHWLALNPMPDISEAFALEDPEERMRAVLRALYGWYSDTELSMTNIWADRRSVPALDDVMSDGVDPLLAAMAEQLAAGFAKRKAVRAACALAVEFWTWRRLAHEGLSDTAAARLMAGLAGTAAGRR